MQELTFIHEKSNYDKVKTLVATLGIVAIFVAIAILFATTWYRLIQDVPWLHAIYEALKGEFSSASPAALFIIEFFASLFFIPSPDELIYYYAVIKKHSVVLLFIAVNLGYFLAQIVNYYLGLKLSPLVYLISKKKLYSARRLSNRYGALGIFMANLLPFLPSPLLTFGLGLTRYNFTRLMLCTMAGRIIKYAVITAVLVWTT